MLIFSGWGEEISRIPKKTEESFLALATELLCLIKDSLFKKGLVD